MALIGAVMLLLSANDADGYYLLMILTTNLFHLFCNADHTMVWAQMVAYAAHYASLPKAISNRIRPCCKASLPTAISDPKVEDREPVVETES